MVSKAVSSDRVVIISLGVRGSPTPQWEDGCVKGLIDYQYL
jgi:hypothetical protein